MVRAWEHFKTITYHKYLVAKGCFRIGLYYQGLVHDLSKYSPTEFLVGAKYYQGTRSPNNAEREDKGYSESWLHHKGRNKHHYEYWIDYSLGQADSVIVPVPMPDRYIAEMIMDRMAASKVYRGKEYVDSDPLNYLLKGKGRIPIHPQTLEKLERMLRILADQGEDALFSAVKKELLGKKRRTDNIRGSENTIK